MQNTNMLARFFFGVALALSGCVAAVDPGAEPERTSTVSDEIGHEETVDHQSARLGSSRQPSGYVWCASEGDYCSFSGTRTVAYGRGGVWIYKSATGGIACTNVAFGSDPVWGRRKDCYVTAG
ncbi:hypothetical protein WMF20_40150 [Sorangium sp. So ce834]|uniref:hypothetical protein n=1 Tax=Sorangium sp. So ce834 TaxID=3133321 RepID=UPI003F61C26E